MNKELIVRAPLWGSVIAIERVNDPVFAEKVLGDGCAILPDRGKIYAPMDGEITSVAETRHAYGIRSSSGVELLIHIGLETVSLKGEGFTSFVKVGDSVQTGDLLAEVDLDRLGALGVDLSSPLIFTDLPHGCVVERLSDKVKVGDPLFRVRLTEENPSESAPNGSPDSPDGARADKQSPPTGSGEVLRTPPTVSNRGRSRKKG